MASEEVVCDSMTSPMTLPGVPDAAQRRRKRKNASASLEAGCFLETAVPAMTQTAVVVVADVVVVVGVEPSRIERRYERRTDSRWCWKRRR